MFRPMYSKQFIGILTLFGVISVFLLAALLKLEITVTSFIRHKVNFNFLV